MRAPLVRLGLRSYAHGASRAYLMREYGLDAAAVVRAVCTCLRIESDITDEELAAYDSAPAAGSPVPASASPARPEDL